MMVGLFSLAIILANFEKDWKNYESNDCISLKNTKQKFQKEKVEWKNANSMQTSYLIGDYLSKNKELPSGDKVVIGQFKDDNTIVFFIAGPSICSLESLSKDEARFVNLLKD